MSGDHTKYHGTAEVIQNDWKYDPITGEPLIDGYPLYSGLPKREWVGLTYEEIQEIWTNTFDPVEWDDVQQIAEIVEAKLKEKNA